MSLKEGIPHPAENARAISGIIGRANVKICVSWKPTERIPTHVAARPASAAEAAAVMRYALENDLPLFPVSSSVEKTAAGAVGGIILNLERMNRIGEFDLRHQQCVVAPGVAAERLDMALEKAGLMFPPAHDVCGGERSVGSIVAAAREGVRAHRYGSLRGWVDSVEAILPSGRLARAGYESSRLGAGLDISGLFIGSRGRLGAITRVTLRLIHRPPSVWTLAAWFDSHSSAADAAEAALENPITPSALVFLDAAALQAVAEYREERPPNNARAMLILETEGDRDAAGREIRAADEICRDYSAIRRKKSGDPAERDNLWEGYRSAARTLDAFDLNAANVTVRMASHRMTEFLRSLDKLDRSAPNPTPACIGSISGGEIRMRFQRNPIYEMERLPDEMPRELFDLFRDRNGESTLPRALADLGRHSSAPAEELLTGEILKIFDPTGVMSPRQNGDDDDAGWR